MENNWRYKTLENLEKEFWKDSDSYETRLVQRCHELRKLQLDKYTIEDLRLMIGQEIGLKYLIPLAIEKLTANLFTEGDLFEGDLLKNVLSIETEFWNNNKNHWLTLYNLIKKHQDELSEMKFDTNKFDKCKFKEYKSCPRCS